MGIMYCVCNSVGSVCNACLGSTAQAATGRRRSVLLLTLSIAIALWFQYSVGPAIVSGGGGTMHKVFRWIPGVGSLLYSSWHDDCAAYDDNALLLNQCAGNAGVYRPTALAALFFAVSACVAKAQPSLNKQVWPAKYGVFFTLVAISMFVPSYPMFSGIFLWLARFGATVFLLMQQVILIDLAYNWNEDWVDRADRADRFDYGSGQSWLHMIVGMCAAFYLLTLIGIGVLYHLFDSCPENTWIITLTLLGIIGFTGLQLSGTEGSLLTSSIMSVYVTYLCYSMVSKNPSGSCNPYLGSNDSTGIAIGLTLTAVSLAWLGWSWTAEERLEPDGVQTARPLTSGPGTSSRGSDVNLDVPFLDPDDLPTSGLVMDGDGGNSSSGRSSYGTNVWKLNVVMALISCFVAMTLTGWGNIERIDEHSNAANPTVGRVNMAMIGISQWTCIMLYVWTLLAPRLFPDRDFS
jgi:serine incorporator 1/3